MTNLNTPENSDAAWYQAQKAHDDRYFRSSAMIANQQRVIALLLVCLILAIAGIAWIGSKSKFIPVVVEVDKLGQTLVVQSLTGEDAVKDTAKLVYREMADLIENLRTVSSDVAANNLRLVKGFDRLDDPSGNYVRTELRKAPPNEVGQKKTVQVLVQSVLRLTDESYQIDWDEKSMPRNGDPAQIEKWRATVRYKLLPPLDEAGIRMNPIGFTVVGIQWQKITTN